MYQGKEITVRGYSNAGTIGLLDATDRKTGIVVISEKDDKDENEVWCEFHALELPKFKAVLGKQYVTVKGKLAVKVDSLYLTSCTLVKVE